LIKESGEEHLVVLGYEKRYSLLFFILRYIDYGTERYDLGASLNVIIVDMNWPRVILRSLFERVRDTRDVSAFVDAGFVVVRTWKGTLELLAKLPCNKRVTFVI